MISCRREAKGSWDISVFLLPSGRRRTGARCATTRARQLEKAAAHDATTEDRAGSYLDEMGCNNGSGVIRRTGELQSQAHFGDIRFSVTCHFLTCPALMYAKPE
jgi:hypothetical protein